MTDSSERDAAPASPNAPTGDAPPRPRRRALLALFLVAALLRLWPVDHGFPDNHVPDATVHKAALQMAQSRDLVPPITGGYPNLLPYALLPCFGVHFAVGAATGEWDGVAGYEATLLEEPWRANRVARIVLALIASLGPVFLVLGLRAAGVGRGAWVGGVLLATCLLHLHLSTQERPWAPMITFFALTAWAAAVHARSGGGRSLVLGGVAAALTASTHQAGLVAPLLVAFAWATAPVGWGGDALRTRLRTGVKSALAFLLITVSVGYPAYVRHGAPDPAAHLGQEYTADTAAVTFGGQSMTFELDLDAFSHLTTALFGYDPVLVVLGLLGLLVALRHRASWPVVGFGLAWAVLFLTNPKDHVRYLLPVELMLCWTAAVGVDRLAAAGARRGAAWLLVGLTFVPALRLGQVLRREDTRAEAARVLAELDPAPPFAVGVRGPAPAMTFAALERLVTEGRDLSPKEAFRAARLQQEGGLAPPDDPGLDWFPLDLWFEFNPRYGSSFPRQRTIDRFGDRANDPNHVLRELGVTAVVVVDETPGDGVPPHLVNTVEPTQVWGPDIPVFHDGGPRTRLVPLTTYDVLRTFEPGGAADAPRAQLPLEMDFALVDLWTVERPGPRILVLSLVPIDVQEPRTGVSAQGD